MRLILTLVIFIMASVTVTGSILVAGLSMPALGLTNAGTFPWVAGAGMVFALPVSYWVAGRVLAGMGGSKDGAKGTAHQGNS